MPNPNSCVITVSAPPRGTSQQQAVVFSPRECVCTWSWGLQPATALIDWVSAQAQPAISALAGLTIEAGGHTFCGYCKSVVPKLGTDGISLLQEFVDNRDFLMWDKVYCVFNMPEHKIVNGQFIRRYWHILPEDYDSRTKSYTNAPYTARQIFDMLFEAPTVESPWTRLYCNPVDVPVYGLNWENGVFLGQAVLEVTERLGQVFTLMCDDFVAGGTLFQGGPYQLVWTVKGVGTLPAIPNNADNIRTGKAISTNPTRIRVLGGRNRYQVMNCVLQPDWKPAWLQFYDLAAFIKDIFDNESTPSAIGSIPAGTRYNGIENDPDRITGWQLAAAYARLMTVGHYADLRDVRAEGSGEPFRDYRRFQSRSRLQLPVPLYISQILLRAFCFPPGFQIPLANGLSGGLKALDLDQGLIAEVTHDPVSGKMTYDLEAPPPSNRNGYAIVQGYQVAQDDFKTLRPEYLNLNDWLNNQALWQEIPFQMDDSGEGDQFIIFDEPVFKSADLIHAVSIAGAAQNYPADNRPRTCLNAQATLTPVAVQVAICFEGENFSFVSPNNVIPGTVMRDDAQNVEGLFGEYVCYSPYAAQQGWGRMTPREIAYSDGLTATQKAAAIAATILNGQFLYDYGGYTVQGSNATALTSMIDRVTLRVGPEGITEDVEFTNERSRNVTVGYGGVTYLQPDQEREFDRKAQLAPLFPGQQELRDQAYQLEISAVAMRQFPKQAKLIMDLFHLLMGLDSPPNVTYIQDGTTGDFGPLAIGTPLFRESGENLPGMPDNAEADAGTNHYTQPVFLGVTVVDNEDSSGPVRVTSAGDHGVVQARVKGPVAVNDAVGIAADKGARDYLAGSPGLAVGQALEAITDSAIHFISVRMGVAGKAGGLNVRGEWDGTQTGAVYATQYSLNDVVVISLGINQGTFVWIGDTPGNSPPYTGGQNWMQLPGGLLGQWM